MTRKCNGKFCKWISFNVHTYLAHSGKFEPVLQCIQGRVNSTYVIYIKITRQHSIPSSVFELRCYIAKCTFITYHRRRRCWLNPGTRPWISSKLFPPLLPCLGGNSDVCCLTSHDWSYSHKSKHYAAIMGCTTASHGQLWGIPCDGLSAWMYRSAPSVGGNAKAREAV